MKNYSGRRSGSIAFAFLFLVQPSWALEGYSSKKKPSSYTLASLSELNDIRNLNDPSDKNLAWLKMVHSAVPFGSALALRSFQFDTLPVAAVGLGEPLSDSIPLNPNVVATWQSHDKPWLKGVKLEGKRLQDYVLSFTATGHGALTVTFLDGKGHKVQMARPITWLRDNQSIRFTVRLDEFKGDRQFDWGQVKALEWSIPGNAALDIGRAQLLDMKPIRERGATVGSFEPEVSVQMDPRPLIQQWKQLWQRRQIPLHTLEFAPLGNQKGKTVLQGIVKGDYDQLLTGWAKAAKEYGGPLMLRPLHDFNGDWYPWSIKNAGDVQLFVQAWQRIRAIYQKNGATNVAWVYSPSTWEPPALVNRQGSRYRFAQEILGVLRDQVDIIGFNAYQRRATDDNFTEAATSFYETFEHFQKPMIVAEAGSNVANHKDFYWQALLNDLQNGMFPQIMAVFPSTIKGFELPLSATSTLRQDFYTKNPLLGFVQQKLHLR